MHLSLTCTNSTHPETTEWTEYTLRQAAEIMPRNGTRKKRKYQNYLEEDHQNGSNQRSKELELNQGHAWNGVR